MRYYLRNTILTLAICGLLSCGAETPSSLSGSISFFPDGTNWESSGNIFLVKERFLVNIKSSDSPLANAQFKVIMPLHGHVPFIGASGPVRFVDANEDDITIDSPDGTSTQGNSITGTTNTRGDGEFTVKFPLGATYDIKIIVLLGTTTAETTISVTGEGA